MIDNLKLSLEGQRARDALPLGYSNIDISTLKVGGNYGWGFQGAGIRGLPVAGPGLLCR